MVVAGESRRRGAPARISLDEILDAALEIVDRDGLDSLTLRALATSLRVTPMSLYRYVDGVDGLLDQVVARLIERSGTQKRLPATWREAVIAYADALRRLLSEHPAFLNAVLRRPIANRPALEAMDGLLGTLRRAGLSARAAADAYTAIYAFCVGFVALERGRAGTRDREAASGATGANALRETIGDSGLPNLRDSAAYLGEGFDDSRFHVALDVIVAGVAAAVEDDGAAAR